ncbi:hypothetical protein [Vibrio phage vB_VpaP_SJSY21]|nr:hypothetical protein [Vibrio phage vB_VpaP_SJSY21]
MFEILKREMSPHKEVKASSLLTGDLFIVKGDLLTADYVKMAVCLFDEDDDDVRCVRPFVKDKLAGTDELEFVGANANVIPVRATIAELVPETI